MRNALQITGLALLLIAGAARAQQVIPLWEKGAPGFEARRDDYALAAGADADRHLGVRAGGPRDPGFGRSDCAAAEAHREGVGHRIRHSRRDLTNVGFAG